MQLSKKRLVVLSAVLPLTQFARSASAATPIYGTTPFQNGTAGGYTGSTSSLVAGGPNSVGLGGYEVGNANDYVTAPANAGSTNRYSTGYILTPSGTTNLGVFPGATATAGGAAPNTATSINTNGTLIAGYSDSYHYVNGSNTPVVGNVEAVWNNSGGTISLPVAVTDNFNDGPNNISGLINNPGTVVGNGTVYNTTSGTALGTGAFVWTNSGTVAAPVYNSYAELLSPGNSTGSISTGALTTSAYGIGDRGLAVGTGSTYNGSGTFTGNIAVTWDTTSTPVTTAGVVQKTIAPVILQQPTLPTTGTPFGGSGNYTFNSASGSGSGAVAVIKTSSQAGFINASNKIAGVTTVYDANTANASTGAYTAIGSEPVVWNGAGSTGTFLPLATGYTTGNVSGINVGGDVAGDIVGSGTEAGVLWKSGASAPTLLAVPTGTNPLTGAAYTGFTFSKGINDEDFTVGLLGSTTGSSSVGNAMLWDSQGNPTDLNSLVPLVASGNGTTAGWVSLLVADAISDDGYISGIGEYYDPNATNYSTGALPAAGDYYRPFEILDTAAAPEPTALLLFGIPASTGMLLRRRRNKLAATESKIAK